MTIKEFYSCLRLKGGIAGLSGKIGGSGYGSGTELVDRAISVKVGDCSNSRNNTQP